MRPSDEYDIGDAPTVRATFATAQGVLTDPTSVTVKYQLPDGTQSTLTAANVSVGVWSTQVPTLANAGRHLIKFFGVGALVAAQETSFSVRDSRIS